MDCKTAVILAAGAGTRMKSDRPKVLHQVCGRPMVSHVISQVREAGADRLIVVVGHGAEQVRSALAGEEISFAVQEQQLGTGHAAMQAAQYVPEDGSVFVLCGDTPLITAETLSQFAAFHEAEGKAVTVLTAVFDNPFGYGRIIRSQDGSLLKIVEQKDADEAEAAVKEVNAGMYCFRRRFSGKTSKSSAISTSRANITSRI